MGTPPAYRKAQEKSAKAEKGIFRRSYWLDSESIRVIETVKSENSFETNDETVNYIIKSFEEKQTQ